MSKGNIFLTICSFLLMNLSTVYADVVTINTGNSLVMMCNEQNHQAENIGWGYCVGFVLGVDKAFNMGALTAASEMFPAAFPNASTKQVKEQAIKLKHAIVDYCIPPTVTNEQLPLVVTKYLQDHPETLNKDNASLVIDALRSAWPCEEPKK